MLLSRMVRQTTLSLFVIFAFLGLGLAADVEVGDFVILKPGAKPLPGGIREELVMILPFATVQQVTPEYVTLDGVRFSRKDVDLLSEAEAIYTKELEANPKSVDALIRRSTARYVGTKITDPKSIADCQAAIELHPENANLHQILCILLADTKDIDKAINSGDRAVELAPEDGRSYAARAFAYGRKREAQKSYDDATKAIELKPELLHGYAYRGIASELLGNTDDAIKDYSSMLRKDYNCSRAFEMRANVLHQTGDSDGALRDAKEAVRLNPKRHSAYLALARITGTTDAKATIDALNRAIALKPEDAQGYTLRGGDRLVRFDLANAKTDLEKGMTLDPNDVMPVRYRAIISRLEGNTEEALGFYAKFIETNPNNLRGIADRAELYISENRHDEAITDVTNLISKNSNLATAYLARGRCYLAKKEIENATKDFEAGLAIDSLNADLLTERGKLYSLEKDHAKAIEYLNKAHSTDQMNVKTLQERIEAYAAKGDQVSEALDRIKLQALTIYLTKELITRGYSAFQLGLHLPAYRSYESLQALDGKNADAYLGMGTVLLQAKLWKRAGDMYAKVIEMQPRHSKAYAMRGFTTLLQKGDLNKVVEDYTQAIKFSLREERPQLLIQRGLIYGRLKDYDKELADFRAAHKLAPENPSIHNSIAWLLATCPSDKHRDGKEAVKLALKGCELSNWEDWKVVDTLAAAYAEAGDMENAIKTQLEAIDLGGEEAKKPRVSNRLELFRSGKPYREDVGTSDDEELNKAPANPVDLAPPTDE